MPENDKREKIIAAAYQLLAEKGYDQASTKEIARAAGVAQGLINYYFPSKDLLFAEVFKNETIKYCESMPQLQSYAQKELSLQSIKEMLNVPKTRAINEPSMLKLRYELFAIGLRNPAVSENLKDALAWKRDHVKKLIESILHLPEEQSRPLAAILRAAFDGLGLQKLSDPDFDYDEAYDTLALIIESYLEKLRKSSGEINQR
ncbi:TetR/AcrR family transcriptional regulator [Paenibacillus hamazuiensis]|uniref:TetR/AcrR family transcriptional regulator n=1 Tax=Paenibacillus hamazuiensis TaxID=2936508 RepID=UPI00200F7490|nr:TetR/AcrR family transcriptional regulator [Paenibacillus hamazuiensis]